MMGAVMILLPHSSKGHQEAHHHLVLPPRDPHFSPIAYALGWIHLHNKAIALPSKRVRLTSYTRLNWELAFTLQLLIQQTRKFYQHRHTHNRETNAIQLLKVQVCFECEKSLSSISICLVIINFYNYLEKKNQVSKLKKIITHLVFCLI